MLAREDVLIVFALENEAQGLFGDMQVLTTGVGKVNATYHLTRSLTKLRAEGRVPKLVLNLGSAGSQKFAAGKIINCTNFIQRDFDVKALGFEAYQTPFEDTPVILANSQRYDAYPEGMCGTGDNFVTDGAMTAWNVVDMEAYALAKTCLFEDIPFGCLKFITDGADGHAANTWEDALADAAKGLRKALNEIVRA